MTITKGKPDKLSNIFTTIRQRNKLILDISIDAVGPLFEYMRSNKVFTWSQMEDTCSKLKDYTKVNKEWFSFSINSSYQIFNYDNLLEFYDFIYDHQCESNIRMLMFPLLINRS